MYVLGIIGNPGSDCHDASAALIKDGKVISAAEQERFSLRKHAQSEAPYDAIKFCLDSASLKLDDIDYVAISWEPNEMQGVLSEKQRNETLHKLLPHSVFSYQKDIPCGYFNHHITHLAAAFYQSGFEEAACLVIDGQGENESITFAKVDKGEIQILKKFPIAYSLGAFYDAAAGYVGLGYDVPGKFMGLAPYGVENQNIPLQFDVETGIFSIEITDFSANADFYQTRENYVRYFEKHNFPYLVSQKKGSAELMMYANFAASVQGKLNEIVLNMIKWLRNETGCKNLVISGGIALNCTMNGFIDRAKIFDNIFVYPATNDAGCSVGAALEYCRRQAMYDTKVPKRIENVYLGKEYSDEECFAYIRNTKFNKQYYNDEELCERVARDLCDNKVVAWFQKGFEFGPRALGARSILANPTIRENINRVNELKGRELWRPLSPVVLSEYYNDIFFDETPENMSSFMLKTCAIRDDWLSRIPAVAHVDKTSRPQYLRKAENERLYNVIEGFYKLSGIPLLINTSLNVKGKPIFNSPREILTEFERNHGFDVIVLGRWYVCR